MFSAFERLMAMRYLRARRQEGFISVIAGFSLLGIALGVATLIIVMAVMNGFRQELLGRVLGLNGHLNVYAFEGGITDYDAAAARLREITGVVDVAPVIEGQALVSVQGNASGALVRGITADALRAKAALSGKIVAGNLDAFRDDGILIGNRMAQRFGLKVGDKLTLVSPQGNASAFGTMPRYKAYPIAALFDVGMYEYDNGYVFMPFEAAQTFFRMSGQASTLELTIADPTKPAETRRAVSQAVAGRGRVFDWQQSNANFVNALQVERNVMFLILTLIIVVAAFNIISSLIMLVKDKTRDIAILRTMGATRGMIMRVFFLTGASIGVTGTIAGFILGTMFALNIETIRQALQKLTGTDLFSAEIYFLSQLPAKLEWDDVLSVVLMALLLSFAATIYPAWRAARLEPVEALRHE